MSDESLSVPDKYEVTTENSMLPQKGYELEQKLTFRLTDQDMNNIVTYAESIQAPVSYAIRTLVKRGLQAETERHAA